MISILTGDIINSRKLPSGHWMDNLKKILDTKGQNPAQWEIFRGDEFQLEVENPQEAFRTALQIKATLKILKLDARISIGIGDKTYNAQKISESNGSAFIRSGETFETLKKQKITLAVNTGNTGFDADMNLIFRLGLSILDNWLPQSAEFFIVALANQSASQEELGQQLGINQAAVSRRQKRAQFDLIMELDAYFRKQIKTITA